MQTHPQKFRHPRRAAHAVSCKDMEGGTHAETLKGAHPHSSQLPGCTQTTQAGVGSCAVAARRLFQPFPQEAQPVAGEERSRRHSLPWRRILGGTEGLRHVGGGCTNEAPTRPHGRSSLLEGLSHSVPFSVCTHMCTYMCEKGSGSRLGSAPRGTGPAQSWRAVAGIQPRGCTPPPPIATPVPWHAVLPAGVGRGARQLPRGPRFAGPGEGWGCGGDRCSPHNVHFHLLCSAPGSGHMFYIRSSGLRHSWVVSQG